MCIQYLDPLIPLTSPNQSIISRISWKTLASSSRQSTVNIFVVMPPDSNNPTLTSSSPLSLDPPSKVVSSISQLTQWLWLAVLAICKWDWRVSRKAWNGTTPHHAPPEPDVTSSLFYPPLPFIHTLIKSGDAPSLRAPFLPLVLFLTSVVFCLPVFVCRDKSFNPTVSSFPELLSTPYYLLFLSAAPHVFYLSLTWFFLSSPPLILPRLELHHHSLSLALCLTAENTCWGYSLLFNRQYRGWQ